MLTGDSDEWASRAQRTEIGIKTPGISNTLEWHQCLQSTFFEDNPVQVVETGGPTNELLFPYFVSRAPLKSGGSRIVRPISSIYSTRPAMSCRAPEPEHFQALFDAVRSETPWDGFSLDLIEGSVDQEALFTALQRLGYDYDEIGRKESLNMVFPPDLSADQYLATLKKKFRYVINRGERDLRERGNLEFRQFKDERAVGELIEQIFQIERRSWKEAAGTSITRNPEQIKFYEKFAPLAAQRGWLRATLAYVDGKPIAHIFGTLFGGVFENLKMSYDEQFKDCSAGHVLQRHVVRLLFAEGIRHYDWQGVAEASKLKWRPTDYSRVTYLIYAPSLGGKVLRTKTRLSSQLRAKASEAPSPRQASPDP